MKRWVVIDRIKTNDRNQRIIYLRVIEEDAAGRRELTWACREGDSMLISEEKQHAGN